MSSCNWFRLRPKGGSEWVRCPQFVANVPVGGWPTFILGFGFVATLHPADDLRWWQTNITQRLVLSGSVRKPASPLELELEAVS